MFDFTAPFERRPVGLSAIPYMHPAMRERVKAICEEGCYCVHDGDRSATLKRRNVGGNVVVYLQCDACGSSLGSALSRQQHPNWQGYPQWDATLHTAYDDARSEWHKQRLTAARDETGFPDMTPAKQAYIQRAREYEEWCRTSPEWRETCKKIAWRSRGHCEACLNGPAEVVHHLTYTFGKLPPAWHLKAVCRDCHQRLHDGSDDWCDWGMAR